MMQAASRIPLAFKALFTAYMAVHLPAYWYNYGPTNFLYFCDVALVLTFVGVWIESALLVSMCCVGILVPQAVWLADFVARLGGGLHLIGMTDYMFDPTFPLWLRLLSLFHGWLPLLLLLLIWRFGYVRRAFWSWTLVAWALLLICFFFMPPPMPNPRLTPVNINYVWGPSDHAAQSWVPPYVWLAGLIFGLPLFAFAPVHLLLARFAPKAA